MKSTRSLVPSSISVSPTGGQRKAHAALGRNPAGGLEVQHFGTAKEAAAVSQARELPTPAPLAAVLPDVLATLRTLGAHKLRVTPQATGQGFEVEVVATNRLYVSRQELAEMLPMFSGRTNRAQYVDKLVALGMPHVNATGSKLFNPHRVTEWLEKHFGAGCRAPLRT